ncbi:hypothetical protein [Pseudomonas protegens]|uniref:hypothetical protein n=1 Tax=Pseudomonas protegens TaxID=380021 RepID=UPI002155F035|nr:hypothetical protein [Pseudomonas protegens]
MSIIRAPRPEGNFYLLNKTISEDRRLSWGARGVLVFLLGKPDHWKVSPAHLRGETADSAKPTGRDGIYGLLDELISAGYVRREQPRSEAGVLGEVTYLVSETPLPDSPYPAEPLPAGPHTANPTLVSIEGKQVLKKTVSTDSSAEAQTVPFESFWKLYPRKANKAAAEKAWKKLKVDADLFAVLAQALAKQATSIDWLKSGGQFIPHAATWLHGKRWEDELPAAGGAQSSAFNNLPNHTPDMYQEAQDGRSNF